ncbi:MAG: hypothetical protein H6679_03915 [Epsilonproteobacteria bacterium]|nr:hypothetical protein [Campylobacterota bacterium]
MKKILLLTTCVLTTPCLASLVPPGINIRQTETSNPKNTRSPGNHFKDTEVTRADDPNKIYGKNNIKKYLVEFLDKMCGDIGTTPHSVSNNFCAEYESRCEHVMEKLTCLMQKYERGYVSPQEIEQEARQTMDMFFQRVRFANINKLAKEMMKQHRSKKSLRGHEAASSKFEYDKETAVQLTQYLDK